MNIDAFLDFLVPIIGFLVIQDNLDAVRNLLGAGGAVLERWHAKLTLLFTHDLVAFFRRNRLRMLFVEAVAFAVAVALFFSAKGYCSGTVVLPRLMLVTLLPAGASMIYGLVTCIKDWDVKPVPLYLAELKAFPDDPHIDPPANPNDPAQVTAYEAAIQTRTQEVLQRLQEYGPRDRSPIPHAAALIYSPLVSAFSLAMLASWMGYYSTFRLGDGLERHWAMLVGLDAYLCYLLCGVGYKVVIGLGRAIVLRVTEAVAPGVTVTIRTLATILPTIDAANAATRIPAVTGQIIQQFADLTEELENRPIAKLELLFVMITILPDPRVLLIATVMSLVVKADHANQTVEGIDVAPERRDLAKWLSPLLRTMARVALVLLFVGTLSRDTVLAAINFFREVLNPFLSLGYPSAPSPGTHHWIGAIVWGLIVIGIFWKAAHTKSFPEWVQKLAMMVMLACAGIMLLNLARGSRFQIGSDNLELLTACPQEREQILARRPNPGPYDPSRPVPSAPVPGVQPPVPAPTPAPAPAPTPILSAPVGVGYGSPSAGRLARPTHRRRHRGDDTVVADVDTGTDAYPGTVACDEVAPNLRDSLRAARACHD